MQLNVFFLLGFVFLLLSIIIGIIKFLNNKKEIDIINNNEDKKNYDLIIVGAGLSGLTAAYEANKLTNNSLKILLLEVSNNYGGNSINEIDGINILLNEKNNDKENIRDNFSLFFNDSYEYGQFASDPDLLKIINISKQEPRIIRIFYQWFKLQ